MGKEEIGMIAIAVAAIGAGVFWLCACRNIIEEGPMIEDEKLPLIEDEKSKILRDAYLSTKIVPVMPVGGDSQHWRPSNPLGISVPDIVVNGPPSYDEESSSYGTVSCSF